MATATTTPHARYNRELLSKRCLDALQSLVAVAADGITQDEAALLDALKPPLLAATRWFSVTEDEGSRQ